jgi:hypothetical protein
MKPGPGDRDALHQLGGGQRRDDALGEGARVHACGFGQQQRGAGGEVAMARVAGALHARLGSGILSGSWSPSAESATASRPSICFFKAGVPVG